MSDTHNISRKTINKVHYESTISRKTIVKKYKKRANSYKRRNRRKRSKKTYLNMLKQERVQRKTEELCSGIQEISVFDMDMKPMCDVNKLPEEVLAWEKQEQVAYWKSRAISLEIENKMLRKHLRNVYAQQIEWNEQNKHWQAVSSHNTGEQTSSVPIQSDSSRLEGNTSGDGESNDAVEKSKNNKTLPIEPEGKHRLKEMEKIYGDKAPKIMGMETALELNYEKLMEEGSRVYWPNIPLKL